MQEHEAYPTLLNLDKVSGFVVPQNYFNQSASELELLHTPILAGIAKQNAFQTPTAYFENNRSLLISISEETNELSNYPKLASIERKNPFITSDDYFQKTKNTIIGTNSNTGGAKIISLFGKPLRYAAAAVLTITIGLWIYNSFFKTEIVDDECTTLACLEKREIIKYKLENFDSEEILDANVDLHTLEMNLNKKQEEKSDSSRTTDSINEALLDYID